MSWVIVEKESLEGVFETFNEMTAKQINTVKYQAVPIMLYLGSLNLHTDKEKREYMQIRELDK